MSSNIPRFDRDVLLQELLRAVPRAKLVAALDETVGDAWRIVEADGSTIWESGTASTVQQVALPLHGDIDVIGHLQVSEARRSQAAAAAQWLDLILAGAYRYQMAADLHLETVHADYETLSLKHAALQVSEARCRELAAHLEQRVKDQVKVIESAQRQLFQSEKMASIGSLAAGMAHEINNPIGFIRSNLGTASGYVDKMHQTLKAFKDGNAGQAHAKWQIHDLDFVLGDFSSLLDESISGAERVAAIVESLKACAGIHHIPATAVDLNDVVRAATSVIGYKLPPKVRLETDLQPLRPVICDPRRINQVMCALLQNALQSLRAGDGLVRVASRMRGDEVCVAVSDNGCGIEADIHSRIFDPFFTTQDVGKGMGLGLTLSHDILKAHNGRIEVETVPGAGSTFTVCLPLNEATDVQGAIL